MLHTSNGALGVHVKDSQWPSRTNMKRNLIMFDQMSLSLLSFGLIHATESLCLASPRMGVVSGVAQYPFPVNVSGMTTFLSHIHTFFWAYRQ